MRWAGRWAIQVGQGMCVAASLVKHCAECCVVPWPCCMQVATGCFRHLRQMFQELEETRPFELLKGQVG